MIEKIKNKIICGDALSILKKIERKSIDLFVSDPPYKITARGCARNTGGMLKKEINKKGDLVLDCFCGVGAVPIASKKLNRNFIGIDLEQEYVDISRNRIKQLIKKREKQSYFFSENKFF